MIRKTFENRWLSTILFLSILALSGCGNAESKPDGSTPTEEPSNQEDAGQEDAGPDLPDESTPADEDTDAGTTTDTTADAGSGTDQPADAGNPTDDDVPIGTLEFSPATAPQGTGGLNINGVGSIDFVAGESTLLFDPASGAAAFDFQVTGDHHFTFRLEVAAEAPVGFWTITATTGEQTAEGQFEITEKIPFNPMLTFDPATLLRGKTSELRLLAQDLTLVSTLHVSFAKGSEIFVDDLQLSSDTEAVLQLRISVDAPLGQAVATVQNGGSLFYPALTVVAGPQTPLRISEVMPKPNSLPAAYLELINTGDQDIDLTGFGLRVDSGVRLAMPGQTLVPAGRLLLAAGDGVPGGATILAGLSLPTDAGQLTLLSPDDQQLDAALWDLSNPASAAATGVAMERIDPSLAGDQLSSWQPAPALIRAAFQAADWQDDRGSPGRADFQDAAGPALSSDKGSIQALGNPTSLIRHRLTLAPGTWAAVAADLDRVAGYATATLFAVNQADDTALLPHRLAAEYGDAFAVLSHAPDAPAALEAEVRVWADPIELFEPSQYNALLVLPGDLTAAPTQIELLPGETETLIIDLPFAPLEVSGQTLSVTPPIELLAFASDDTGVAMVNADGLITAVATGDTIVTVQFDQPDFARTVEVAVIVGSNAPEGESCADAIDVSAGGLFEDQSNAGAQNDYNATGDNCPYDSSEGDRVYLLHAATETDYQVTVTPVGSSFDPMIYVMTDCSSQDCLAGTVFNGPGEAETIDFTVAAGQSVYLVVDGETWTEGNFSLLVEIL